MITFLPFQRFGRVLTIAGLIALAGIPGGRAWSEEHQAGHHQHGSISGVRSMDVYTDGSRLHLLTGESVEGSEQPALLHRHSGDGGATWSPPVPVATGMPGAFSLRRGMDARLAAAGDHLIAVWMTAGTDQWGSGPMATALSGDGGKTWQAGPNPADDRSTTGHGFIAITAGPRGRFHLTWLDSRDGKQGLRYAQSEDAGKSWSANVTAQAATCECCSNTIVAGPEGEVAILFRDGNPRDMQLVRSTDGGRRWLAPVQAGGFDWRFEGCPHVGGGLTLAGKGPDTKFHALAWTGKAGSTGIYHIAIPPDDGPASTANQLGDATASHPDLAADTQGNLAAVWDSRAGETPAILAAVSTDAGNTWSTPQRLSPADATASQPRIVSTAGGFRAFWTEERSGKPTVWATAVAPATLPLDERR